MIPFALTNDSFSLNVLLFKTLRSLAEIVSCKIIKTNVFCFVFVFFFFFWTLQRSWWCSNFLCNIFNWRSFNDAVNIEHHWSPQRVSNGEEEKLKIIILNLLIATQFVFVFVYRNSVFVVCLKKNSRRFTFWSTFLTES